MGMKKWLSANLGEDLLMILDKLGVKYSKESRWRESVKHIRAYFNDEPSLSKEDRDRVDHIIDDDLGLKIKRKIIETFWDKLSPSTITLLMSLDSLVQKKHGEVSWPVISKDVNYGDLKGPWGSMIDFNAAGSMGVELEPMTNPDEFELIADPGVAILRMGLEGKLEMSSSASLPLNNVNIKGGAGVTGQAELDYFFGNDEDELLIEAVWNNLQHLASPFNSEDIWEEREHGLRAIRLQTEGSLDLSLGISAAHTCGTSFPVSYAPADLDTQVDIGARAQVGFNADVKLGGAFNLLVKPVAGDKLSVSLRRASSKQRSTTFSLDSSIGISGLDKVGDAIIETYLPDPDKLTEKLLKYVNLDGLGKKIDEKLGDYLDADFSDQLQESLSNVNTWDELVGVLKHAVSEAANDLSDPYVDEADQVGREWIQKAAGKLNLSGDLMDKLVDKTQDMFSEFLTDTRKDLIKKLEDIIGVIEDPLSDENRERLARVFKPLLDCDLGPKVKNILARGEKITDELVNQVVKYINRYREIRAKLVKATQGAAKLKIGMSLAHTIKVSSGREALLEFEVDISKKDAREYYKQMLTGSFENALKAVKNDPSGPHGILLIGGSIKSYILEEVSTGINLDLFGFKATSKTILNAGVDAFWDLNGSVVVYTGKAELNKTVEAFGEFRNIRFVNLFEIAGTGSATDTRLLNMGLAISYKDENLKIKELRQFLNSFEKWGLIEKNTTAQAMERFEALSENKLRKASVGLSMPMTQKNISNLTDQDPAEVKELVVDRLIEVMLGERKGEGFKRFLGDLDHRRFDYYKRVMEISAPGYRPPSELMQDEGRFNRVVAKRIGGLTRDLLAIIKILKEVSEYEVNEQDLEKQKKKINTLNKDFNGHLDNWLEVRGILLGILTEEVPKVTIVFMRIIRELMADPHDTAADYLIPVIRWGNQEGELIV